MNLGDLNGNPDNPRKISDNKLGMLKKSLEKFGDLGGIVKNVRTNRLVGGHQRIKVLPKEAEVILIKKYEFATETGTVGYGYVDLNDERYSYREVDWDEATEKAANIAANAHGGDFDLPKLANWINELDAMNFDLELTGFDSEEIENMMAPNEASTDEHRCPTCGYKKRGQPTQ